MVSRIYVFAASSRAALVDLLRDCPAASPRPVAVAGDPRGTHRLAIAAASQALLDERLELARRALGARDGAFAIGGAVFYRDTSVDGRAPTAYLFPGYGVRHTALLDDLLASFPFVEAWLDALGSGVPPRVRADAAHAPRARRAGKLTRPLSRSLDAVMLSDLAIWEVLTTAGVACEAVAGHSYGENAALAAAGLVDDYPALVRVLAHISREARLDAAEGPGMLAVTAATMPALAPALADGRLVVALDNCPRQIVLWGDRGALETAEADARARGDAVFRLGELQRPIHTDRFPLDLATLRALYAPLAIGRARVPVWSAQTVDRLPEDPDAIRDRLASQWRSPVHFRALIQRLYDEGIRTFVEAGPGDRLSGFVRDTLRGAAGVTTIPTNIEARPAIEQLFVALGRLFVAGHDLDWSRLDARADAGDPSAIEHAIAAHVSTLLEIDDATLDRTAGFFEMGLGSMGCLELVERLARVEGIAVPQTLPFDHPTISRLAEAIARLRGAPRASTRARTAPAADAADRIAIVGIGCRFPGGADSPAAFWRLLDERRDAAATTPADRRELPPGALDALDRLDAQARARVEYGAFLPDVAGFDAAFFGIAPREALAMDPQQRMLLEVAWEALEHAAIDPRSLANTPTGVFVGISNADYASRLTPAERIAAGGYLGLGNAPSVAAGRLSYVLGLQGPSLAVDTACSSSLAAVHLACRSLRAGECGVALAGGVNLLLNGETTIFLASARALSPSGRCRPFDAAADGYVRGEGCGMLVLKREADAIRDGDRIVAVLHGSAMNHDGRTSGLTVPNGLSQEAVVRAALADAGAEPSSVAYVEAHGTGTPLGDPIEAAALGRVFAGTGGGRVAIGSVKSNIGHLEAAAGAASLIKTALQYQHGRIAASLHAGELNARVDWPSMAVRVATDGETWTGDGLAGVSAFGMSGTNVHVIVGPPPAAAQAPVSGIDRPHVLALSAQSRDALRRAASRLAERFAGDAPPPLASVSRTLTRGRAQLRHRAATLARTHDDARAWLRRVADGAEPAADGAAAADARGGPEADLVRTFLAGDVVDWRALQDADAAPAELPAYPFEHERYWIDAARGHPMFSPARTDVSADPADVRARIIATPPAERAGLVAQIIQDLAASVLQLPDGRRLEADRPLGDAGLDSLMALQLSNVLAARVGVTIAADFIVDGASAASLAERVIEGIGSDERGGPGSDLPPPSLSTTAPLSYGQQALWFLWMLAPGSPAYNQSVVIEAPEGGEAAWRAAAARLLERHPALRTRIVLRGDEPEQQIEAAGVVQWRAIEVPPRDGAAEERAMAEERNRPFDLAVSPIRFLWLAARGRAARLLVTIHHTACDAWSLEIVRRELPVLSNAAAARAVPDAPRYAYQDFARWQRARLAGPEGERLWKVWRERLALPRAQLDLPLDRERPVVRGHAGDVVRRSVGAARAEALRETARAAGVTPFVVVMTSFYALLYRWTRQTDLVIGTMSAGRGRPEFSGTVGYFVEPVPVRVAGDGAASLSDWLAEVHRASRAALADADFPFPLLVERLGAARDAARSPIFDVTFNFLSRRAGGGSPVSDVEMPGADAKFDLTLTAIEHADGLDLLFGYSTELFDRQTIETLSDWFDRMLAEAGTGGARAVDAIPLADPDSLTHATLRGRRVATDTLAPVHEQIRAIAVATPDALAVAGDTGTLTYRELVAAADAFTAELRAAGAASGVPIALVTPRSGDWVVGMLAILQAGGAFVPLDPSTPPALRERMRRAAGARIQIEGRRCLVIDDGAPASEERPRDDERALDRLAYVIFTSGSTGEPKGVMIDHRALANYVASVVDDLSIAPGARHAWVSTPAADLGHTAIFPALTTGGTLVVAGDATVTERTAFAQFMTANAIDYLKIVPSHLAALIDEAHPVLPARGLFLGGEPAPAAWAARLRRRSPCRIFNHYGPTETTVGVMTAEIDADVRTTVPLDRVVANVDIRVVDAALSPVPRGIPGEVLVGGPCVARGYLGAGARGAEQFVHVPGIGRAYRTGDLARVRPDGALLLMGRDDGQFKLRGYRIETGQIENALAAHPGVAQAVVLPRASGGAGEGIDAWIVAARDRETAPVDSLRAWLAERLPPYMVPDRIMCVARIPLTPNGKVDRPALRAVSPSMPSGGAPTPTASPDPAVARVIDIWRDVLGRDGIGPGDDFFSVGGHSLAAIRVASRIVDAWGVQLPLASFFTHRTPERLALLLRARAAGARVPRLTRLRGGPADAGSIVLFPGAGGSLLYFEPLAAALGDGLVVEGAQAIGLDAGEPVPASVEEAAESYARAIEESRRDTTCLAGHSFGALVAFETALRLRARGRRVDAVVVIDNPAPGLNEGPAGDRDWAEHIALRVERLYGIDVGARTPRGTMPPHEWLAGRLRAAGLLPAGADPASLRRYIDLYRANVFAAAAYRPAEKLTDVPLAVVRAETNDPALNRIERADPTLGWQSWSALPVKTIAVPGTHITMLIEPHVRRLARALLGIAGRAPVRVS